MFNSYLWYFWTVSLLKTHSSGINVGLFIFILDAIYYQNFYWINSIELFHIYLIINNDRKNRMKELHSYAKYSLVITYLLSSMLTTVTNKYILSVYAFKMAFFFLCTQSFTIAFVIYLLHIFKYTIIRPFDVRCLLTWMPCSFLLTIMIYTGAKGIEHLSISLFTLLKNFSIIVTALGENILYNRKMDRYTLISFLFMLLSSFVGEYCDFTYNQFGFLWIFLNIISTSCYVILFKYNIDIEKTTNFESIFFCNILSIPLLLLCSVFFDTYDARLSIPDKICFKLIGIILLSCLCACFIAYSTAMVLKHLSSTTLSFLGATNKLFVSFSGILLIGENNVGALKISSLVFGSLASLIYVHRIDKE